MKVITLIALVFVYTTPLLSQNLQEHKWKNRVVILMSDQESDKTLNDQLAELTGDVKGLMERKLILYTATPSLWKFANNANKYQLEETEVDLDLFDEYRSRVSGFEFILVGLDGGVKMRKQEFVSKEELFATIDGMPMRRVELRH